jgi:hypothetical protein
VNQNDDFPVSPLALSEQKRAAATESYEAYNRRVRAVIHSDPLLELDVTPGWPLLYAFVEVHEHPATPFPKPNSALRFKYSRPAPSWFLW